MEDQEVPEQSPPSPQPESQKLCRYCRQNIHKDAKACHHCRFHQSLFVQYFLSYGVLAVLVALGLSIFQLNEAWKERIAASEAVRNAESAVANANIAVEKAKKAQCDLIRTGFQLIDLSNTTYYYILHRVALLNEWKLEIFSGIDDLKKRLKEEHSKSDCPAFPELFFPTKTVGVKLPPQAQ